MMAQSVEPGYKLKNFMKGKSYNYNLKKESKSSSVSRSEIRPEKVHNDDRWHFNQRGTQRGTLTSQKHQKEMTDQ